jgi:predicted ATPase
MGEVWKARDPRLERFVAVKFSLQPWGERFAREARALAQLNHPNIVAVYDVGTERDVNYLVMEFVDGESLQTALADGPLPLARVVQIGRQIADALAVAHSVGLLHRDVKPGNILITTTCAKLTDFGLAMRVRHQDEVTVAGLTAPGALVGTVRYMSPEQARGLPVTEQSDVFALGAVLYEAATGQCAFSREGVLDTLLAITSADPVPPSRLNPVLPAAFDDLILQALAKDVQRRISTAAALRTGLDALLSGSEGAGDRAAGSGPPKRPEDLPRTQSRFIGREAELQRASSLLLSEDVRLLTITGPGGIGKTRFAIELASTLRGEFQDGVVFVALDAVRQAENVLFAIAKAVQVREEDARNTHDSLIRFFASRQYLLILDNFEHVSDAAGFVSELLNATSRLKLVVTSRSRLQVRPEHHFELPPFPSAGPNLHEAAGVVLFLDRARAVQPELNETRSTLATIAEICERLDGLPLAIELAAARTRLLSPKQLLVRLGNRLAMLSGRARDVPARQQTLRNTIAWSYELLDASERRLLRQLSVFAGSAAISAVEAIPADSDDNSSVLDSLMRLVDHSLVRTVEDFEGNRRVQLLETIREYAHEGLIEQGEANEAHSSHARQYVEFAELAGRSLSESENPVWLDRLETEYANCLAASDWLLAHQRLEEAFRLAVALWRFWHLRGYWTEGRVQLNRVLEVASPSIPPMMRAHALYAAGVLADAQCDFDAARTLFEEQLVVQREFGDQRALATAMNNLGVVAMRQGDFAAAKRYHTETLEIVRSCGLDSSVSASLSNLGQVALCECDYAGARSRYLESLAISRRVGNVKATAWTLCNLGDLANEEGHSSEAELRYSESVTLFRQVQDRAGQARAMTGLGTLAYRRNNLKLAAALYQEGLVAYGELGDRHGIATVLESFALLAAAREDLVAVLRLAAAASAIQQRLGLRLEPSRNADLSSALMRSREAVGADAERLWSEGWNMAIEVAMQYALGSATS